MDEFKKFLAEQGLWEREVDEIIKAFRIEKDDRILSGLGWDEYKIKSIQDAVDFSRNYLEAETTDPNIINFIDEKEFAEYLCNIEDDLFYCNSSDRVIIFVY